jgi:hypothetical protein
MTEKEYQFADLQPESVDEIRLTEQRLSEENGQPIILIAYRSDAEKPDNRDANNESS